VKQAAAKFGGTMRMLGALTSKACYYRYGGCSLGFNDWRYDAIGTTVGYTASGVVTKGYQVQSTAVFFNSGLGQFSTVVLVGSRFAWTTGSVSVTAIGRGRHKTVHYAKGYDNGTAKGYDNGTAKGYDNGTAKGYDNRTARSCDNRTAKVCDNRTAKVCDNRTPTSGRGTMQLVTPVLTHWLQPAQKSETVGFGIFRIKFVPEAHAWWMLIAGISCLGALPRRKSGLRRRTRRSETRHR
jgi:hypothetical protein